MKINDLLNAQTPKAGEGRPLNETQGTGNRAGRSEAPEAAAGDKVSITHTAQQLNELHEALAKAPVVDGQRVAQVRAAIEEGRYEIDPVRIAEKLMRFEEQL